MYAGFSTGVSCEKYPTLLKKMSWSLHIRATFDKNIVFPRKMAKQQRDSVFRVFFCVENVFKNGPGAGPFSRVGWVTRYKHLLILGLKTKLCPTWADMIGDRLSISSTMTRFFSSLGEKWKVSPSSRGLALLNMRSPSSSPRWAIWYRWLGRGDPLFTQRRESMQAL